MRSVRLVVGTRPEAIKLAPVARALAARGLQPEIILTGQHPMLDPADFGLDGFRLGRLDCPGTPNPHRHVRAVQDALLARLSDASSLVVVQGDTSSAMGGALAAAAARAPLAHVEAGLRTFDPSLPWPEEEYRIAIDNRADLLFAPTATAAANLRAEQVCGEVHVTGNTSIDALLERESRLPPPRLRQRTRPVVLVTCHRRESWGPGLEAIAAAIRALCAEADFQVLLHPNRHVAADMQRLLGSVEAVTLLQPCPHLELLALLRDADLAMSDSGGIQEEAPALGVPLLVLRDKTERPEGIACGSARLVGTSTQRILAEARRLLRDPVARAAMSRRSFPYGDGHAARRIAAIIEDWLERRDGHGVVNARSAYSHHE